ncbi:D-alanyl-D-alanine carboxypeptidase family protein [Desulforamulus reducens]|uniref:D-alanyl-D-alanine carboxypeptidase family protein n=1 Tax=Desulforamulus reducens TaxID=59610 RepID=UPI0002FC0FE6|nr:D-alanyl-D-alanine carboxypeptidase family protein [Desulforamulus reducens]
MINPVVVFGEETKPPNSDVLFLYENLPAVTGTGIFDHDQLVLSAYSALVMDAATGQVLFAKNPHQARAIASTTKIMTALVAIECGNLNSATSVSQRAAGVEGSSVYLKPNEKLTLEQLLYGALMRSGNDACVAIAEQIAVREDIFVGFMNMKARQLGAKNTHFCNSNGLPNDHHYSSAYDLALITRAALKNPVFSRIVSTKTHVIPGTEGKRLLSNTNKMLWSYQGADGVKTGTTNAAGKCLVSSASRDGRRLIAVVLHSDDRWNESIKLLNYGFNRFEQRRVVDAGKTFASVEVRDGVLGRVPITVNRDVVVTVPIDRTGKLEQEVMLERKISAPVFPGQVVGKLQVLVEGQPVGGASLLTLQGTKKIPYYQSVWRRF